MRALYRLTVIMFLLVCSGDVYSQHKTLRTINLVGYVVDSFLDVGITNAKVTLMAQDSTVVDSVNVRKRSPNGMVTYTEYSFNVPAQKSTYIIKAEAPNYKTGYLAYSIKHVGRNVRIEMPTLKLKKSRRYGLDEENVLDEVVVKATKIKMYYRGDTLVYNADAFSLPDGSMLDGLIKQMPGATLNENGEIHINGRKIDYLSLNGKKMFDGNNQLVISNLPYYTVKNLKVFEKNKDEDEALGKESRVKDYVMDVSLKKEYSKNNFMNAKAGIGTKDRMLARAFDSFFSDTWGGIAYVNVNNLNQTRLPGWDGSFSEAASPKSNVENKQFGLSGQYERNQGNVKEEFSLSGDIKDTETEKKQLQELFMPDGNVFKNTDERQDTRISKFKFSNDLQIKKPYLLKSRTQIEYQDGKDNSTSSNETLKEILANHTRKAERRKDRDLSLSQEIVWSALTPWGDRYGFQAKANYEYGRVRSGEHQNIAYPRADADSIYEFVANENVKRRAYDYSLYGLYQYELLGGKRILVGYQYEQADEKRDRARLRNDLDDNSFHANTLGRFHMPSIGFDWQKGKWYAFAQLLINLQTDEMKYCKSSLDTLFSRSYTDLRPSLLVFRKSNDSYLELKSNYGSVTKPRVTDIVDARDDSDPLLITLGNTGLKKSSAWHTDVKYSYHNRSNRFSLDVTSNVNLHFNNIVHSYMYNEMDGSYTIRPENVNGYWAAALWLKTENIIGKARRWSFRNDVNYDYSHKIGISGTSSTAMSRNVINSHIVADKAKLSFQYKRMYIAALGGIKYQGSRCDSNVNMNYNAYDIHYGINMNCRLPLDIQIACDMTMYQRKGYDFESINDDNLIGNVSLSRSFIKGRLLVSLTTYDIFHQLSSIERTISDQSNTETTYNSIPRYGMISLTYKFGKH